MLWPAEGFQFDKNCLCCTGLLNAGELTNQIFCVFVSQVLLVSLPSLITEDLPSTGCCPQAWTPRCSEESSKSTGFAGINPWQYFYVFVVMRPQQKHHVVRGLTNLKQTDYTDQTTQPRIMRQKKKINYPHAIKFLEKMSPCHVFLFVWRRELPFTKTAHLTNPWNEHKPVKIGRDGQVSRFFYLSICGCINMKFYQHQTKAFPSSLIVKSC